jgi:hypothetical protein
MLSKNFFAKSDLASPYFEGIIDFVGSILNQVVKYLFNNHDCTDLLRQFAYFTLPKCNNETPNITIPECKLVSE